MYQCVRCSSAATDGLLCAKHASTPTIEPRRKYKDHNKSFYSSRRWRYIRLQVLSQHPLCEACDLYDIVSPAIDIDHVWPLSHSPSLGTSLSNLQALDKACHTLKTSYEAKGIILDYRRNRRIDMNTGDSTLIKSP